MTLAFVLAAGALIGLSLSALRAWNALFGRGIAFGLVAIGGAAGNCALGRR